VKMKQWERKSRKLPIPAGAVDRGLARIQDQGRSEDTAIGKCWDTGVESRGVGVACDAVGTQGK
jgi:hypothetical protein